MEILDEDVRKAQERCDVEKFHGAWKNCTLKCEIHSETAIGVEWYLLVGKEEKEVAEEGKRYAENAEGQEQEQEENGKEVEETEEDEDEWMNEVLEETPDDSGTWGE